MAATGRIRRRLALAIAVTALLPLLVGVVMASSMLRTSTARYFNPEIEAGFDRSLGVYQELARAVKAAMRNAATAIAAHEPLRRAAADGNRDEVTRQLAEAFDQYPNLVSLTVTDADGEMIAERDRGRPVDPEVENTLEVLRPLAVGMEDEGPQLQAVFAADKTRFDELEEMSQFVDTYRKVRARRPEDEKSYLLAFAVLLGLTIVCAVGVGSFLARGVSNRIGTLAAATRQVGAGDLSIRVPEDGNDEVTDLARAFNRMVAEVESSRARIEYLQRIGAWQEMARRLAHEIKNPLTPIQLAVQEMHRRYDGSDPRYSKLVESTLEIVEDEVGTLRRLVTEFSDFARLPRAKLEEADLVEFLLEQREQLSQVEEDLSVLAEGSADREQARLAQEARGIVPEFDLPEGPAPVFLDRQMLRRAMINLVRNSAQAIGDDRGGKGRVLVRAERVGEQWQLDVEDDGPGIPKAKRDAIFDPYVTSKDYGTGLGLAITKKIVVEHGGTIVATDSPLGGARMRICLPAAGTPAAEAARESQAWKGDEEPPAPPPPPLSGNESTLKTPIAAPTSAKPPAASG